MLGAVLISNKIRYILVLITIFGLVCVSLFFGNQNSNLQNQLSEHQDQITELQNQISDLEDQNNELENQTIQLQNQISEFHNQTIDLENQNSDLQDKNNELQEQLNETQKLFDAASSRAMIIEFSSPWGWGNPVGVTMAVDFNITILNNGINDIEGLTLEIKRLNFDSDPFNITRTLGILHSGEIVAIREYLYISMDRYFAEFYTSSFVTTLRLGDRILDEQTLQITKRQF